MADNEEQGQDQEIPNGLYAIFSMADLSKCVDVAGGYDDKGRNVWAWEFYGGSGQLVWVEKKSDAYVFQFPLTGFVLEVQGGVAEAGHNVWQYEYNDYDSQKWSVIDTGEIAVVKGQTLKAYFVRTKLDNNFTLWFNNNGHTGLRNGDNLALIDAWVVPDTTKFVFYPYDTLPDGCYRIAPYLTDVGCLGVAGHSSAKAASCVLEAPVDDSNFQIFKVENYGGNVAIRCIETGYVLDAAYSSSGSKSTLDDGDNVVLYPWTANDNQLWTLRLNDRKTRNGVETPIYAIINKMGSMQKAVDVNGNAAIPKTNVQIWSLNNNRDAQKFWFIPAEAYGKDLTVPANIQASVDGEYGTTLGVFAGTNVIYPAWNGDGEYWKVRYRYRSRWGSYASNSKRNGWTHWKSLDFGYETNDGWGEPGVPNADATLGNGVYTATEGVSGGFGAGENSRDLIEIEFEIRQLVGEWGDYAVPAHSGSSSKVITVAYKPTLTIYSVTLNEKGATVSYNSDFKRSCNKIKIWVDGMFTVEGANLKKSGTLTTSTLKSIPTEDCEVVVKWQITSCDGITNTGSSIIVASVDLSKAPNLACTTNFIDDNCTLQVTCPSGTSNIRYWLILNDSDKTCIEIDAYSRTAYIPYPLTKPFDIMVAGIVNGALRVFKRRYNARTKITRLWNFDNSTGMNYDYCICTWGIDGPPEETVDTSASSDDRPTTSGKWNRVTVGKVKGQSRNITSVIVDKWDPTGRDRIRRLLDARYAWYRNPEGEVVRVAISSLNETRHPYGTEFSVEMRRIDEHT